MNLKAVNFSQKILNITGPALSRINSVIILAADSMYAMIAGLLCYAWVHEDSLASSLSRFDLLGVHWKGENEDHSGKRGKRRK